MKKSFVLVALLLATIPAAAAFAGFGSGLLNNLKKGEKIEAKVDVDGLTGREVALKKRVSGSTIALAKGLIEVQEGVGRAASAAKLKAVLEEAQAKQDDFEQTKNLVAEVNNASDEIKQIDMQSDMDKGKARLCIGKALLYLGAGTLLDIQATNDARLLVTDITNGIKAAKSSPMAYGLSAGKTLLSGLNTARFVAETVPAQLNTMADVTKGLNQYAQTNKIETPSKEEQEKLAANMEKE